MPQKQSKKTNWQVTTQSVYSIGRQERARGAYETILPEKHFKVRPKDDYHEEQQDRSLRKSFE